MTSPSSAIQHPLADLNSYFIALAQYALGYSQGTTNNGAHSASGSGSVFGNEGNADSKFQHSSLSEIRFSCLTNQDSVSRGAPDNCGPEAREFVKGLRQILETFPTVNGDIRARVSEVYSYLLNKGDALARKIVKDREIKEIAKAVISQLKENAAREQEEELASLERATTPNG